MTNETKPVAWRVKDYADGWVLYATEAEAQRAASNDERGSGGLIEPLYTRAPIALLIATLRALQASTGEGGDNA